MSGGGASLVEAEVGSMAWCLGVAGSAWEQSCRLLPNFGRPPEFGRFQEIAQKIAQNFCAIFKIGQKHPKKLPNGTKIPQKAPEIAQNFYVFEKITQKSSRKAPEFFSNKTEFLRCSSKQPKKLPKSSRILEIFQSGNSSGPSEFRISAPVRIGFLPQWQ